MNQAPEEIVEVLTEPERQHVRDWWDGNTRLAGAPLPDILDILQQSDSFVGIIDEWWLGNGDVLADQYGAEKVSLAAYITVIIEGLTTDTWRTTYFGPTFTENVKEILERLP